MLGAIHFLSDRRRALEERPCRGEIALKAYPSASGATKCGSERGEFVIEQMTNNLAAGGTDD
jgi:hypothetical protein